MGALLEAAFWGGLLALAILARGAGGGLESRVVNASTGSGLTALRTGFLWIQTKCAPARSWYERTPPLERVAWGGLIACALLGLVTLAGRLWLARRSRVLPAAFRTRFHARLVEGRLDWAQALDYCELHSSPAARVALAAIRRWGRPAAELERAVALARQQEIEPMRQHVGTLRRVAALAPLIGLFGSLTQASHSLAALGPDTPLGAHLAAALVPLTFSVGLAIVALLAYDGLVGRIDRLAAELDRIGADTVDALAPLAAGTSGRAPATPCRPESAAAAPAPHGARLGRVEPAAPRSGTATGEERC
jgi:biopolymer transport protein ExbB